MSLYHQTFQGCQPKNFNSHSYPSWFNFHPYIGINAQVSLSLKGLNNQCSKQYKVKGPIDPLLFIMFNWPFLVFIQERAQLAISCSQPGARRGPEWVRPAYFTVGLGPWKVWEYLSNNPIKIVVDEVNQVDGKFSQLDRGKDKIGGGKSVADPTG
ncbi:hypothetical protein CK203_065613 [Vitis vinifera]|uniref:Uncharacterized protein n=1 Tax=Vitis vinifera TaxID=29760 RepID=A0A438FXJ0_VITVI|nr:hypothetical protein CK203_065613 [Vitis vinifera]